ncbi:MAG: transcriptional repressor [Actinobacteria bacterium]|nr:transcriptional repressor [Actinomycetota bacterium]
MRDDLHATATRRLRRVSQRYTSGRRVLVEVLAAAEHPLTIPEIVELDASLATSSVYRNLAALEQAGIATKIVTSQEHARYELSEDFGHHHHHLVCIDCGRVSDFTLPAGVEQELDAALRRAARKEGYVHDTHRLDLTGTCPECQ